MTTNAPDHLPGKSMGTAALIHERRPVCCWLLTSATSKQMKTRICFRPEVYADKHIRQEVEGRQARGLGWGGAASRTWGDRWAWYCLL